MRISRVYLRDFAMRWRAESSDSMGRIDLYSVFREPKLDDRAAYARTLSAFYSKAFLLFSISRQTP